jgi:predicted phosphodiesterase
MRVLILSDVHGNWPALQAVLRAEPDAHQILCLGDLVNYGPQPAECVAWAMQLHPPNRVIQGNHDRAFGPGTAPDCAPANQRLAESMQSATNHLLTPEMKQFLAALQPLQEFRCGETTCVAYHGKARDPHFPHVGGQNAQWPWESDIVLTGHPDMRFVLVGHPDLLFLSHTHMPMKTCWGNTLVVNPGSVGLPTDGDPRAAYAIWEEGEVTLRRAAYDVEETARALERLTLEDQMKHDLQEVLRTGEAKQLAPVL